MEDVMVSAVLWTVIDCYDPERLAGFWAATLAGSVSQRDPGEYEVFDSEGRWTSLYLMHGPEPKHGKNRLHIDLVSSVAAVDEIQRLVSLGASFVEVRSDESEFDNPDQWTVMVDPEGNEFCISNESTVSGVAKVESAYGQLVT